MAAHRPLTRELPAIHQDGRIKFRAVLGMARAQRKLQRRIDAREEPRGSCYIHRIDRVREDMAPVRQRIAEDLSFWSVDNVPTTVFERRRVEYFGHVWFEYAPVAAVEPEPVELRRAA